VREKGTEKMQHYEVPSPVVLSGTKIVNGAGVMLVINVGKNSSIGKINEIVEGEEEELTPLQMKLEKIARDIGYFGLISAVLLFAVLMLRWVIENSLHSALGWKSVKVVDHLQRVLTFFITSLALLVVAIPEGLPLAVTLSLAFSVSKMMNDNNLVRKLQACETMGGANYICTDKTGTLTKNEMKMTHFWNVKEFEVFD
jgi:magnesium-transporting ATPase (P-type)